MNYGLYISASSMSVNMARQDVMANNLANVNTSGFKPDVLAIRQRDPVRVEDRLTSMPSNALLERLGAGVMPMPTSVDVSQGALQKTGRPLDVALEGEGFFVVRAESGPDGLRVTRDGRLAIASDGTIVTATEGRPVLGVDNGSLQVNPSQPVEIGHDGTVAQAGQVLGQLQVAVVPNPQNLVKVGANLMKGPAGEPLSMSPSTAVVQQGFVESSGVNPITTMMGVTNASRAAQSSARMMGYINELMGAAVNRLGRVN